MASSPRTSENITANGRTAGTAVDHRNNLFNPPPFNGAAPHAALMEDSAFERGYEHAQAPHWTISHFSAGYFTTERIFTEFLSESTALSEPESTRGRDVEKDCAAMRAGEFSMNARACGNVFTVYSDDMKAPALDKEGFFYITREKGMGASCKNHALFILIMLLQSLFSASRAIGRGGAR